MHAVCRCRSAWGCTVLASSSPVLNGKLPAHSMKPTPTAPHMQEFYSQVDDCKRGLASIHQLQQQIVQEHEHSKTIVKSRETQLSREKMQVRERR